MDQGREEIARGAFFQARDPLGVAARQLAALERLFEKRQRLRLQTAAIDIEFEAGDRRYNSMYL